MSENTGAFWPETKKDNINHPPWYKTEYGFEAADVIEAFKLDYLTGSAVKYILRAGKKDDEAEDIKKAIWFLQRKLKRLQPDVKMRPGEFVIIDNTEIVHLNSDHQPWTKWHEGLLERVVDYVEGR